MLLTKINAKDCKHYKRIKNHKNLDISFAKLEQNSFKVDNLIL